jgi:transposase
MIQEFIQKTWGVLYNTHYLSQLLHQLGFSFQKARFAVGGRNPDNTAKREEWVQSTWPAALKLAQSQNALLLFGDEVSFPQWGSLSYTWAPVGQQPTVATCGIRKGYKVFGLVDYFSGKFFYQAQEERLNSQSYKSFLWKVLKSTKQSIVLIQDGAPYHTSKELKLFFEQFKDRLTCFQLPSYSPDFNPIEKLWKAIKQQHIHLHYFPSFDALKAKVDQALRQWKLQAEQIHKLFGGYLDFKVA